MPRARERAEAFVQPVRVAPRKLRTRANAQQREVAKRGLADISEGGEGLAIHAVLRAGYRRRLAFEFAANHSAICSSLRAPAASA